MRLGLTIGVALVVLVGGLVLFLRSREPSVDCGTYSLDRKQWADARRAIVFETETDAEKFARQAARNLVRCDKLLGQTRSEVRTLLGKPSYAGTDDNPRPHAEYGYVVGFVPDRGSEYEDSLFMEFDKGRVVYAAAPERDRGGRDEIESGDGFDPTF